MRFLVELEAGKPAVRIGKTLQALQALGCMFDIAQQKKRAEQDRPGLKDAAWSIQGTFRVRGCPGGR